MICDTFSCHCNSELKLVVRMKSGTSCCSNCPTVNSSCLGQPLPKLFGHRHHVDKLLINKFSDGSASRDGDAILSNSLPDFFLSEVWVNSSWTTLLTRRTSCSSSSYPHIRHCGDHHGRGELHRNVSLPLPSHQWQYLEIEEIGNQDIRGANKEPKVHQSFRVHFKKENPLNQALCYNANL